MIRPSRTPVRVDRHDDAGLPAATLAALEREAAHLTRRDGRRRLIPRIKSEGRLCWEDEPPAIEEAHYEEGDGPVVLASVDIA